MAPVDELVEGFRRACRESARVRFRVRDVAQAVELAGRLRQLGKASDVGARRRLPGSGLQWFRGQIRDWPALAPTYARLALDDVEDAMTRLERFKNWAAETAGLEELVADDDKLIAVAQHYGIATDFLDFTTSPRVAGFFASDGDEPPSEADSCIICLDPEHARWLWDSYHEANLAHPVPELLDIDVSNLWRLEAQHGTFVWCPYMNLDAIFPLPRITFPYTGPFEIPRHEIYPERASPLERLVNHYFQEEQIHFGTNVLYEVVVSALSLEKPDAGDVGRFKPEMFVREPTPDLSWSVETVGRWMHLEREQWREVAAGARHVLAIDAAQAPPEIRAAVERQVAVALAATPALRRRFPAWTVEVGQPDPTLAQFLTRAVQRVWDGMAALPYDDEELALAVGATAALVVASAGAPNRVAAAERLLPEPFGVEIGGPGVNVHARAWAVEANLRAAVRDDFEALLRADQREGVLGRTFNVLIVARDPRLLFDFERLRALFARELIPTQVALDFDNPSIFSPARADILGPA